MKNKLFILVILSILLISISQKNIHAQLLAHDDFKIDLGGQAAIPLSSSITGSGWASAWNVQNNNENIPGANITDVSPLTYGDLQTSTNYAIVNTDYLSAGHSLDVTPGGLFDDYLNGSGKIGNAGTTLWFSILARQEVDGTNFFFTLSDYALNRDASPDLSIGKVSGKWGLSGAKIPNDTASAIDVVTGNTVLIVMKIQFNVSDANISLFINPSTIGDTAPSMPNIEITSNSAIEIESVADFRTGSIVAGLAIDEIRFGKTYADVTPVAKPTIDPIPDQSAVFDDSGQHSISLSGITDGLGNTSTISISAICDNQAVLSNDSISISYSSPNPTGNLFYSPELGKSGVANIIVTVSSGAPFSMTDTFSIEILNSSINNAPLIDNLQDVLIISTEIDSLKIIDLSGISDGDPNKVQNLTITATSSNTSVITNPVFVKYNSDDSTGSLEFTPLAIGTSDITIRIKDNGGTVSGGKDSSLITFTVNVLDIGNFGLIEDFNDNILTGWVQGDQYILSEQNGELKIIGDKNTSWGSFNYQFLPIDISSHPYVSLRIKSNLTFNIAMAVGNQGGTINGYSVNPAMPYSTEEILASDKYQKYNFYFNATDVDYTTIDNLLITFNPMADFPGIKGVTPEVYFEDLRIGVVAKSSPSLVTIPNQAYIVQSLGTESRDLKLRHIFDGTTDSNLVTITATSSNIALLPNPVVNYSSTVANRDGTLTISPIDNVIGESIITVIASATSAIGNKEMTFKVKVNPNTKPVIDTIEDVMAVKNQEMIIKLSGIDDGDTEAEQKLTITATSSNTSVIPNPITVEYDTIYNTGIIRFTPLASAAAGTVSTISITLTDDGDTLHGGVNTNTYTFDVTAYDDINNPPTIICPKVISNIAIATTEQIVLTGLGDGDNGFQNLSFNISGDNSSIATNFTISSSNDSLIISYDIIGNIGTTSVSLSIYDDGGTPGNNGNDTTDVSFDISVTAVPLTGYADDFSDGVITGWTPRTGQTWMDETGGVLHINQDFPSNSYPANIINFLTATGKELDISKNPYLSLKVKSASTNNNGIDDMTEMEIYLCDYDPNNPDKAYLNTKKIVYFPEDDQWHEFTFDFSNTFYEKDGWQIDSTRINFVIFNLDCRWFYPVTGDYWFDDVKFGDSVDFVSPVIVNIDKVPNQVVYKEETIKSIQLTGISDGEGSSNVDLKITVNDTNLITNVNLSSIVNGNALLVLTLATTTIDSSKVIIVADNLGSVIDILDTIEFIVYVADTSIIDGVVTLDPVTTYQTMIGIGSNLGVNKEGAIDMYNDLNYTLLRIFDEGANVEPQNDNNDPNVMDLSAFNLNATDFAFIKEINEKTNCHNFFYTPLSPPTWLKYNKATFPLNMGANNNKIMPEMYDEYAEWLAAIVKLIKQEAGVELYAIGMQNEPEFNEPYGSCRISASEFVQLIKVTGERFKKEGLSTRIMMPEDPPSNNWVTEKVSAVIADPQADQYLDLVGVHTYAPNGIDAGNADSTMLVGLRDLVASSSNCEGLWHTETSGYATSVWEGQWGVNWAGDSYWLRSAMDYTAIILKELKFGNMTGWTDLNNWEAMSKSVLLAAAKKQFTRFINNGAVRIESSSTNPDILNVAFIDLADNSTTVILINRKWKPQNIEIAGSGIPNVYQVVTSQTNSYFKEGPVISNKKVVLPPRSVTTLYSSDKNLQPTIDQIQNIQLLLADGDSTISLSGITDGDPIIVQNLTGNATSSDPGVATVTLSYVPNNETGSITITPLASGVSDISVTIQDDGGTVNGALDSKLIVFSVNVVTGINNIPEMDDIPDQDIFEDAVVQTINLSGITDGDIGSQVITLTAGSSAIDIIPTPIINYSGGTSATLSYQPIMDMNGNVAITVSVEDDGGNGNDIPDQAISKQFVVNITPVNDQPNIDEMDDVVIFQTFDTIPFTLRGINQGDPELQGINVVASSSDPLIIETFVQYVDGDTEGILNVIIVSEVNDTVMITLSVQDDAGTTNGGVDEKTITFTIITNLGTGIEDDKLSSEFIIFPNPVSMDYLTIQSKSKIIQEISIYNLLGKQLSHSNVKSDKTEINVSSLKNGIYIIEISTDLNKIQKVFVKE